MPDEQLISVVMPVHNALPHLDGAIQSILDQTHTNFEFVILDDASTDGSTERLREWAGKDSRIRLFEVDRNLGPVASSNAVVRHSAAPLVARMDADDLCHADRLRQQLRLLEDNPQAGLVASLFEIIDEQGHLLRGSEKWRIRRRSPFVPFAHGAIMFRRSVFDAVGGYHGQCEYWEDQDLVVRIAAVADVLIIPSALYQVRQWTKNTRLASNRERVENAVDLMYRSIERLEEGRRYDDLLQGSHAPRRVDPRVFISSGSLLLWAGERPRLLRRLLRRGKLKPDLRTIEALVWTAWARLSPSSLRAFLRVLLWIRNFRTRHIASDGSPVRWKPRATVDGP